MRCLLRGGLLRRGDAQAVAGCNKELDRKSKHSGPPPGISDPNKSVDELFAQITTRYVDLRTGKFVDMPPGYDPAKAAKDPKRNIELSRKEDRAGIKTIAPVQPVYLVQGAGGTIES